MSLNYIKWTVYRSCLVIVIKSIIFILLIEYLLVCMYFDPKIESQVCINNIFFSFNIFGVIFLFFYNMKQHLHSRLPVFYGTQSTVLKAQYEHSGKIEISKTNQLNVGRSGRDSKYICMRNSAKYIDRQRQTSLSKYESSLWGREFLTRNSKLQLKLLHKTFNISLD